MLDSAGNMLHSSFPISVCEAQPVQCSTLLRCCSVAWSSVLAAGLLQEMLHNVPSTQGAQAVMVLCHLALAQPQLKQLPKSVFKVSLS